jgi:uncharacterized protein (DUF885 family)
MAGAYLDLRSATSTGAAVVFLEPARPRASQWEEDADALSRRHTLAHETYPGHRAEALFRRGACELRDFVDDRYFVEGWGTYAEDLVHETSACAAGDLDDYVRASAREDEAIAAAAELLIATGAADDFSALALQRSLVDQAAAMESVGTRALVAGYDLSYSLGLREIRALREEEESRLGAKFDLRAFHSRLLSEGPIPVPLIRDEWRASSR